MPQFESGDDVLAVHPHPAFERIRQQGYEIRYGIDREEEECPGFQELTVEVWMGEQSVAANFTADETSAHCQNVCVDPAHQRRGVATAIYVLAEMVFGKPLYNFWAGDPHQSDAAQSLWANPNRPFGRRVT